MLKLDTFFIGALISAIDNVRGDIAEGTRPPGPDNGGDRQNSSEVAEDAMPGVDKSKMMPGHGGSFLEGLL